MRADARLAVGRVLAAGAGLWLRRFLPIHAVTAACLAPLVLVPEKGDRIADGTVQGIFGLAPTAWIVAFDCAFAIERGISRNAIIACLAQLAVATLVVRDAHARLAGRRGRSPPRAMLGLVAYGIAGLAGFAALDFAVVTGLEDADSPLPVFLGFVSTGVLQAFLAAWFWLALPAAAVDGCGFLAALARSRRLGRGSRVRVVTPLLLLLAMQAGSAVLAGRFAGSPWLFAVPGVLFLTLKACVLAAAYREICLIKEGPAPEEVGAVFA